MINILPIDANTSLYLVLGSPVGHSLSPALHNAAFGQLGLNSIYLAASVAKEQAQAALQALRTLKISGANITTPLKEAVVAHLDDLSEEARLLHSVNTIINQKGRLFGETTDGFGFYQHLRSKVKNYNGKQAVALIGTGAAARAAAYTLAQEGLQNIYLLNRSKERAHKLAQLLSTHTPLKNCFVGSLNQEDLQQALNSCQVVIYSLPVDSDLVLNSFKKLPLFGKTLFDFRYNPALSAAMAAFSAGGGKAYNGLGMLLWQAAEAFRLFTGLKAPLEAMQRAINYY